MFFMRNVGHFFDGELKILFYKIDIWGQIPLRIPVKWAVFVLSSIVSYLFVFFFVFCSYFASEISDEKSKMHHKFTKLILKTDIKNSWEQLVLGSGFLFLFFISPLSKNLRSASLFSPCLYSKSVFRVCVETYKLKF